MSRKVLWGSLALVVAVLVGASTVATGTPPAWLGWTATAAGKLVARVPAMPWWAAPAGGAVLGVVLAVLVRAPRRRASPCPAPTQSFDQVLGAAIQRSGDARRIEVNRLAQGGSALGRISRETRLARDAVRTVMGNR